MNVIGGQTADESPAGGSDVFYFERSAGRKHWRLSISEAKLKANRTNILVGSDPTECLQLCTRLLNRRRCFSFTLLLNRSNTYVQFQYKHLVVYLPSVS